MENITDKRDRILEVAKDLILSKGYTKTSISEITKRCNFSKGSFYSYFSSKEEMLSAIIDEFSNVVRVLLVECEINSNSFDEFIERYIKRKLTLSEKELELGAIYFNLISNIENIDNKNVNKLGELSQISYESLERSLKKYKNKLSIKENEIKIVSLMIIGIERELMFFNAIECNEDSVKAKTPKELKETLQTEKIKKDTDFIIERIKKMIK